jgi:hypothetical protein
MGKYKAIRSTNSGENKRSVLSHFAVVEGKPGIQAAEPTMCSLSSQWINCAGGGNRSYNSKERLCRSLGPEQLGRIMQKMSR